MPANGARALSAQEEKRALIGNLTMPKSIKGIQRLSKTCPHLTVMDGTIEILPIMEMP